MTTSYSYRAVDATGHRARGVGEAESPGSLTRQLEGRGLVVLEVRRIENGRGATRGGRVNRHDVLELTRGLASLLRAGVPLSQALATTAHIVPSRAGALLEDLGRRTARGESVATALAAHKKSFPPMYRGVVRAGERSGDLAGAFATLTEQMQSEDRLRARLVSASIYPILLAVGGLITSAILVLVVLPRFAELLTDAQAALPRSTAMLLGTASTLRSAWPVVLLGIGVIAAVVLVGRRSRRARDGWAKFLVHMPVVGNLRRYALGAHFARLTSVLLVGGAPLLLALDDVLDSIADPVARDEVERIRAGVHDGLALHRAIAQGFLFPPMLARLIAIGEESGRLAEFLRHAADICEERAERVLQRLVALIEPAMILAFGILIAFVALSLLQALYGIDAGNVR